MATMLAKEMIEKVMGKEGEQYHVTHVVFGYNVSCRGVFESASIGTDAMTVTRETAALERFISPGVVFVNTPKQGVIPMPLRRYTEAFINVSINDMAGTHRALRPIIKAKLGRRMEYYQLNSAGSFFFCLTSGKKEPLNKFVDKNGNFLPGVIVYTAEHALCTAGMMKQGKLRLYAQNLPGFDPALHADILSYGMPEAIGRTMAITNLEAGKGLEKELSQASTRLAQREAPAVPLDELSSYAVFFGKFKNSKGEEFADGMGFVGSHYLAKAVKSRSGIEVDAREFKGLGLQTRPYSNKTYSLVVGERMMRRLMKMSGASEIIVLPAKDITSWHQAQFDLGVASKGKEGAFAGKILVILHDEAKLRHIDYFSDLNGQKSSFDIRRKSTMNILALGHDNLSADNEEVMSSQPYQTLALADANETLAFIAARSKERAAELDEAFSSEEGRQLSVDEVTDVGGTVSNLILQLDPKFARAYRPLWKQVVSKTLEGINREAGQVRIDTDGVHGAMIPDMAAFFGANLLDSDEFYNAYANKKGYSKAFAVKYPKMHPDEFSLPKLISKDAYMERAEKALSKEDYILFRELLSTLDSSWVTLPAIPTILNLHAGSDFDGDKIFLLLDERIVNIASKRNPLAVICD